MSVVLRIVAVVVLGCLSVASSRAEDLTVFAAASMTDVLKTIGQDFEKDSGTHVVFNFAASNVLARQIEAGAPADIFISADVLQMDRLVKAGIVNPTGIRSIVNNTLVIVVPAANNVVLTHATDLAQPTYRKIALAQPDTVPAGIYSRTYLTQLGIWGQIQPRIIPCENVRAALAAVEGGNVDAGIVYATDALHSTRVRVAYSVPAKEGPLISYPGAVLLHAPRPESARKFIAHLSNPSIIAVFTKNGFLPPPELANAGR